ncbi:MAG: hypothetical protein JSW44_02760 [Candidatus Bathyarchaeota archaeon]|nr:MAG: hypothetical protein JSW44_02760 [Candidatus Bathyarchaeota archaeon]
MANMKVGLVTYTPEEVEGFDLHVYYVKRADGSVFSVARDMQNDVTCFCDAKAIRENPSIVAVSKNGPALRKNRKINVPFDFVCPTNPEYKAEVLDYIEGLGRERIQGVTLNLYHFAEEEFCVCSRCVELWRQSGLNWTEWRAQTVTNFLKEAKSLVKGTFAVEMFPDPVLAKERFGINFKRIAELVDYFHVPLSSRDYLTNYWVDLLARDFIKILKKPVVVELSAEMLTDEKTEALLKTVAYLSRHNLRGVLLLVHNSENARQVCSFAVNNSEFRKWLKKYEFTEMTRIVDDWAKLY